MYLTASATEDFRMRGGVGLLDRKEVLCQIAMGLEEARSVT